LSFNLFSNGPFRLVSCLYGGVIARIAIIPSSELLAITFNNRIVVVNKNNGSVVWENTFANDVALLPSAPGLYVAILPYLLFNPLTISFSFTFSFYSQASPRSAAQLWTYTATGFQQQTDFAVQENFEQRLYEIGLTLLPVIKAGSPCWVGSLMKKSSKTGFEPHAILNGQIIPVSISCYSWLLHL